MDTIIIPKEMVGLILSINDPDIFLQPVKKQGVFWASIDDPIVRVPFHKKRVRSRLIEYNYVYYRNDILCISPCLSLRRHKTPACLLEAACAEWPGITYSIEGEIMAWKYLQSAKQFLPPDLQEQVNRQLALLEI
jgi:hypothetical protein